MKYDLAVPGSGCDDNNGCFYYTIIIDFQCTVEKGKVSFNLNGVAESSAILRLSSALPFQLL